MYAGARENVKLSSGRKEDVTSTETQYILTVVVVLTVIVILLTIFHAVAQHCH